MSLYSERFKEQIPEIYKNAEIEDFQLENPELVFFFKNWMKNPESIFIYGRYGAGKTYLTYALIKKLISSFGFWPIFGLLKYQEVTEEKINSIPKHIQKIGFRQRENFRVRVSGRVFSKL